MASRRIVSRKMAALQMAIAVYRSSRFGFGRSSTVPCRGAVHAFLRTRILTWNGFLHSMHGRDVFLPKCTSQPLDSFTGNKLGFRAWIQQAVGADRRLALSSQWVWVPYGFHICAQPAPAIGNWQPATSMQPISNHPACIPQIPVRPTNRRAFRNGSSA